MLLEKFMNKRTVRKYQDKKVEREKIEQIIKAALISPSGATKRPWKFVVVDDPEKLAKLSVAKSSGGNLIEGAPLAVVILGDEVSSLTWIENCANAATYMQLEADEMGLGSCWVQFKERFAEDGKSAEDVTRELFGVTENLRVFAAIAFGYAAEEKPAHTEEEMDFTKVHYNNFGTPFKK